MKLFEKNKDKGQKELSFEELKAAAEKCTKCPLSKGRTKVVFGSGPVPCDLMLIGEAPGGNEDIEGLPFVGRAGKLLTDIFNSVGIERNAQVYITNTVKCRPPDNRTPVDAEINACRPFLEAQIKLVAPKIIILAGSPAVKTVLKKTDPITSLRGKWHTLEGTDISVMPVFHPSYLLRNPQKTKGSPKWLTWNDFKEIKNALNYIKKVKELEEAKKT